MNNRSIFLVDARDEKSANQITKGTFRNNGRTTFRYHEFDYDPKVGDIVVAVIFGITHNFHVESVDELSGDVTAAMCSRTIYRPDHFTWLSDNGRDFRVEVEW